MARLDTGWHVNPKVLSLGWAAMGLHAWSISYCDDSLSDGFIPNGAWPALRGARQSVQRLVKSGVWIPVESGFMLHDYLEYNRSRAHVESYRLAKQAAGRAGGQASAQARAQARSEQALKQTGKQNPTPGPGSNSVSSELNPAGPARHGTHARARAVAESPELLAEHLQRIAQERASHALPRQPSEKSSEDDAER